MAVKEEKRNKVFLGQADNSLVMLFAFNTLAFAMLEFVHVIYQMSDLSVAAYERTIFNWFVLPADVHRIATRPWTIFTHMFVHHDYWAVIPAMFWLAIFGYVMQDLTGNRRLVPVYLFGGLAGAVFYVVSYNMLPAFQASLPAASFFGSNAAIMAVAVAATTLKPDYRFFPMIGGGIPLWIVAGAFVIIDVLSVPLGEAPKYIAHIAGGLTGYLFVYRLRKGHDWSVGINSIFSWFNDLFNPNRKDRNRKFRDEFFYKVHGVHPYRRIPNVTQKRIDEILDKINQEGYHLLTDEEKDILRRASSNDEL